MRIVSDSVIEHIQGEVSRLALLVSAVYVFFITYANLTVIRSEVELIIDNRPYPNGSIRPIPPLIIERAVYIVLACIFEARIGNIANVIER